MEYMANETDMECNYTYNYNIQCYYIGARINKYFVAGYLVDNFYYGIYLNDK